MRALVAAVLLLLSVTPTRAWCDDGHRVVGWIAEERLTPAARAAVGKLLGPGVRLSDYDVASWADDVKNRRPETGPWHYVNIPLEAASYRAERDCPRGDCVIARIEMLTRVVGDSARSLDERSEALRFLVHLVADLHQPLHCAERTNAAGVKDRGGNLRAVLYPRQIPATNLHAVWDTSLVLEAEGVDDVVTYAKRLSRSIGREDVRRWQQGSVTSWAEEAHRLAAERAYRGVDPDGKALVLPPDYVTRNVPTVDEQLSRAGVRLAALLNAALK